MATEDGLRIMASLIEDGIYFDVSRDEYDRIQRTNWSTLKHMGKSPAHYQENVLQPNHDTNARRRGRAAHLFTFEPEKARNSVVVWDLGVRRGKDWDVFKRRAEGNNCEILTADEYEQAVAIGRAARSNALAQKYLSGGRSEVTLLWTDKKTDLKLKSRMDFLADVGAIADLKTCRDASPEGFGRATWSYKHHCQAAMYVDAYESLTTKRLPYLIIATEAEAPFVTSVYRVPEMYLHMGRDTYRELLLKLAECRRTNHWPGYSEAEEWLTLPSWAVPEDDDPTGLGLKFPEEAA